MSIRPRNLLCLGCCGCGGCGSLGLSDGCVVSVHTGVRAELLVTVPKPRRAGWCDAAERERELAPLCALSSAAEASKEVNQPLLFKDASTESIGRSRMFRSRSEEIVHWYQHWYC